MPPRTTPLAERLWRRVAKGSPDACWPWTGYTNDYGYGVLGRGSRSDGLIRAHRAAWLVTHGTLPDDVLVLHTCDNPPCCNPAHLFLGTHADNTADMSAKGRHRGRLASEFTEEQQRAIVAEWRDGEGLQREVAARHGISQPTLSGWARRYQ